jgi:DNA (cytosine-5)-methyltransferase 1
MLNRHERVADLREFHGAVWVESPSEMLARMTPYERDRFRQLRSEQLFLLERGKPSPRLDPALDDEELDPRVACAITNRRLMRRALGVATAATRVVSRARVTHGLSLCSGIGGIDLGLRLAVPTYRTVCHVEIEPACQDLLLARMAGRLLDRAPIWGDLKRFDGRAWRGLVDVVHGGYPCQPFSTAGSRRGADDARHLWPHIAAIVAAVEPQWCLFENVAGHLSLGASDVVRDLAAMGYRVALGFFTASELGAPHERERLFILAHPDTGAPAEAQGRWPVVDGDRGGRTCVDPLGPADPGVAAVGYPAAWPPGPRDLAWRDVAAADPTLAPGVDEGGRQVTNLEFVEWLMGFPRGWTAGLGREARLDALGNAVVPLVAALAWEELTAAI